MVQVRKLVLAIAAASALSTGTAYALGLGGLTVKSTLNQPLVAEIELTQVQDLNPSQVVPSLATSAEFAQAGVARQPVLDDLTFTPVIDPNGRSVLRITSSQPVRDPFVKFLVQVLWPNGRVLREYSLLLDPPKGAPVAAAPAQVPSTAPAVSTEQPATPAPENAAPASNAPAQGEQKYTQYTTANNDNLWQIAERVRNGGTVQQTMLAIQALNPDAFIAGNINRLKKGQVLRLPSAAESTALPQGKAIAQVAEQNRAWRQGRSLPSGSPANSARQVDATRRERAGAAPARIEGGDNLSLVAADGKKTPRGRSGDIAELNNRLAVTQENLDSTRRENAELRSRLDDLQSQLDKLQRLMQLKNDQLAKMQVAGAAVPPAATSSAPALSPNTATNPSNAANPTSAGNPAMPADIAGNPAASNPAGKPPNEIAPEDALPIEGAQVSSATPDQPLQVQAPASQPDDLLTKMKSNPMVAGLVAGLLALLVLMGLLIFARRRKARQEAEKHRRMARALAEENSFSAEMDLPESSFEGLEVPPPTVKPVASRTEAIEAVRERPADTLDIAQSHLALGRPNQAIALLEEALQQEPQRSDLRLKLMEIQAQQGNADAFAAQERKLPATGQNHAEVERLKARYPLVGAIVAGAAAASAAAIAAELEAKYVEDLISDPAEPWVAPTEATPEPSEPAQAELPSDFDLSLDDLPEEPAPDHDLAADTAQTEPEPTASELDFDAILREQTGAGVPETEDLSDFDLSLSDDEPDFVVDDERLLVDDELPSSDVTEADRSSDFDLSLPEADPVASAAFASEIDDVNAELERLSQSLEHPPIAEPFDNTPSFTAEDAASEEEPDFDFLSGTDEAATKLDLARAYIEMGDADGARDILDEVMTDGNDEQKSEARDMLSQLV